MEFFYTRLRGRTKIPIEKDWINKSTNDRSMVKEWLHNGDNIGIVCAKSGVVVVDVDVKHGGVDAWAVLCHEHGEPKTRMQVTPSGGKHYFFLAKQGTRYVGEIQKGIDVRHNHQIVCAPSTIGGKSYSYMDKNAEIIPYPKWIAELIEKKSLRQERIKLSNGYLMSVAKEIRKFDLSYENWLMVGMAFHSADDSASGLDCFIEASLGPSYQEGDETKCVDKWKSFKEDKDVSITINSALFLIRKLGGVCPPTCNAEDFDIVNGQKTGWTEEGGKYITHSVQDCLDRMNEDFRFYTKGADHCVISLKDDNNILKLKNFLTLTSPFLYRQQKGKRITDTLAGEVWAADSRRKEIDGIVFSPTSTDRQINLFTGMPRFEVSGAPRGIFELLEKSLVVKDAERKWLLQWLAHIVQHPFDKSTIVPVHITKEGTGKGILYDMCMRQILGKYFTTVGKAAALIQNFNKHLSNKFLTFIDEATWSGDKTEDGVLKQLTGSSIMSIEEKFGATYEICNPSRYVIASNNADAVCIGASNRRYAVLNASSLFAANASFFNPIAEAIRRHGEAEKFGAFLAKHDLTNFNAYALPDFRNGEDTKFKSAGAVGEFWSEVVEGDIKLWIEKGLRQKATYEAFNNWRRENGHWQKGITKQAFWKRTFQLSDLDISPIVIRHNDETIKIFEISPIEFFQRLQETLKINLTIKEKSEYYDDTTF